MSGGNLWGQDSSEENPPSVSIESSVENSGTEDSLENDSSPETQGKGDLLSGLNQGLEEESLLRDIQTSSQEQLMAWCQTLGLNSTGSVESLQSRLYSFYGLSDVQNPSAGHSENGSRILIETAQRSEYFVVTLGDGSQESVVRLTGEVLLTVEEPQKKRTHTVHADEVIFNQEGRTITALGNIRYLVDNNGNEEEFTGDSLTFEVRDWSGVIFQGSVARTQTIEEETVDFFFRGDSIRRAAGNILILDDGVISSDGAADPDYSLRAKKIWITGPGQWGIFSATLYVGHVPVLYLPFYWKSGNDLLFNPVIGNRTREGYYIQTTTYLWGQKPPDDGFSILGFGDSGSGGYDLEREGLFLIKKPQAEGGEGESGEGKTAKSKEGYLKYMLDYYTSLGGMTGFSGSFPKLGASGALTFDATIGVSRSISPEGSVYFPSSGERPQVHWNSSYLGPLKIPFRWGTKVDFAWDKWSIYADWYSDPYYLEDFGDRAENFDWLSFLLGEEGTDVDTPDLITEMRWEVKGSHRFDTPKASPWLSSVSLDSLRASLTWRNKANQDIANSASPDRFVDPARNFYYPNQLVLPDVSFSLSGSTPAWKVFAGGNKNDEEVEEESADQNAENLAEDQQEAVREEPAEDPLKSGPQIPSYRGSYSVSSPSALVNGTLNYGLKTQLYIEGQSQSDSWDAPSDIDFAFDSARINTTQRGDLRYSLDFFQGITGFSGTSNLSGFYQVHRDLFGSGAEVTDSVQLEDLRYSKMLWDHRITFHVKPFVFMDDWKESSLKYDFDANLYSLRFAEGATVVDPEYEHHWIQGEEDIRKNEASAFVKWTPSIFSLSANVAGDLPPLDERFSFRGTAGLNVAGFRVDLSQQTEFKEQEWTYQPLIGTASWKGWDGEASFSQSARYDVENNRISTAETRVTFWGFETTFKAGYADTYRWDGASYSWLTQEKSFVPMDLRFGFKRKWEPKPFWRNRVRFSTELDTGWDINLRQPTKNELGFKWTQTLHIYKFLDLSLSFRAANKSMYLYFPWWREQLGISQAPGFFEDLIKSFNVFDTQSRLDSQFNMDRVEVKLVHHLRSWDLTVEYKGWPAIDSDVNNYRWRSELSLFVKWNPLPIFNQRTEYKNDQWTVDSFK
ncbi:MAG: hypothetical protein MI717_04545 [Spirochaetales bacterium]|nr:hypothetical protein [Spirochaetales bacterium]